MRLALDHHYSTRIAIDLRSRGHDVVAAVEKGWESEEDELLLELCEAEARALVTDNVGDFAVIARQWAAQGRRHAGLIFTSDASLPRGCDSIGRYVEALGALLAANDADDAFADRIWWLSDAVAQSRPPAQPRPPRPRRR